jgi:hypothetical protein
MYGLALLSLAFSSRFVDAASSSQYRLGTRTAASRFSMPQAVYADDQ